MLLPRTSFARLATFPHIPPGPGQRARHFPASLPDSLLPTTPASPHVNDPFSFRFLPTLTRLLEQFLSVKKSASAEESGASSPNGQTSSEPMTLGRKLSSCREEQGISLEEAAKTLHLRPTLLRELENDDLRSFTHASYARLTILGYARFLRIPQHEVQPWLPEIGELATEPHQYLDQFANPQPAARRIDYVESRSPAKNPLIGLLKLFLVLILLLLIGYGWIFYVNLSRIQPTGTVPAAQAPAPEFVGEDPVLDSLSVPSPLLDQDSLALELHAAETVRETNPGVSLLDSDDPLRLEDAPEFFEENAVALEGIEEPEAVADDTPAEETATEVPAPPRALPALPALPVNETTAPEEGSPTP
jgi:cytoskeleton protein RodZ